jgi:hypothetical protein
MIGSFARVSLVALTVLGIIRAVSAEDELRLNQIQVIGTHNSYHIAPHPNVAKVIGIAGRNLARDIEYTHRPLQEQFSELGIRQIELDLFSDPDGGRYAQPFARRLVIASKKDPGPDHDPNGELLKPGIKIIHAADFDFRSTVNTFVGSLRQIREWSLKNPKHVPIFVLLELKESQLTPLSVKPVKFSEPRMREIEEEVLSVFDRKHMLTPSDVRGDSKSLIEAIEKRGWPKISECRGKVMFAIDNGGTIRDRYLKAVGDSDPLAFVSVAPTHPWAGWMKVNDPVGGFQQIQNLVKRGFMVRTRADADTRQSRENDTSRREKAFASGAQFISTDYPEPNEKFSDYQVRFKENIIARRNPVSGPLNRDNSNTDANNGNDTNNGDVE